MNELKKASVKVEVNVSGVDEAVEKAERLVELLKEAKSLADDLASDLNKKKEIFLDDNLIIVHQENHD